MLNCPLIHTLMKYHTLFNRFPFTKKLPARYTIIVIRTGKKKHNKLNNRYIGECMLQNQKTTTYMYKFLPTIQILMMNVYSYRNS